MAAALPAFHQLGGRLLGVEAVRSMAPEGPRTALLVCKAGPTPARLPRAAGTPSKKPL